jgi:Transglutaminase-like superfamily
MRRVTSKYRAVLWAAFTVAWIRILLRIKPLPQVLARLHRSASAPPPGGHAFEDLAYYVDRWLQVFPYHKKGNCLPRSLTLYRFARRSGHAVEFRCGVRKDVDGLEGHAWLMLHGQPFHESGPHWQQFTVTYSYPSEPSGRRSPDMTLESSQGINRVI